MHTYGSAQECSPVDWTVTLTESVACSQVPMVMLCMCSGDHAAAAAAFTSRTGECGDHAFLCSAGTTTVSSWGSNRVQQEAGCRQLTGYKVRVLMLKCTAVCSRYGRVGCKDKKAEREKAGENQYDSLGKGCVHEGALHAIGMLRNRRHWPAKSSNGAQGGVA